MNHLTNVTLERHFVRMFFLVFHRGNKLKNRQVSVCT